MQPQNELLFCAEISIPDLDIVSGQERLLSLLVEGEEVASNVTPNDDTCGLLVLDNDGIAQH